MMDTRMGAYNITRKHHGLDVTWMPQGSCYDMGPPRSVIFFADEGRKLIDKINVIEAKELCRLCPVQVDCLEYALEACMEGIWGGTTSRERAKILRRRKRGLLTTVNISTRIEVL